MNEANVSPPERAPARDHAWRMFDRIAPRYDLLNRLLSLRRDVTWRRKLYRHLPEGRGVRVLDLATGTADVLLSLVAEGDRVGSGVGLDMAGKMLLLGQKKIAARGLTKRLQLVRGDATCLGFESGAFDVATIAFGIRNVVDTHAALSEMRRVLKSGGRALVLEFSLPSNPVLRSGYLLYFRHVLPRIGGLVSGDAPAYRYLNQTVETYPYGQAFCELMRDAGFRNVTAHPLTFGIATIYTGDA